MKQVGFGKQCFENEVLVGKPQKMNQSTDPSQKPWLSTV